MAADKNISGLNRFTVMERNASDNNAEFLGYVLLGDWSERNAV